MLTIVPLEKRLAITRKVSLDSLKFSLLSPKCTKVVLAQDK